IGTHQVGLAEHVRRLVGGSDEQLDGLLERARRDRDGEHLVDRGDDAAPGADHGARQVRVACRFGAAARAQQHQRADRRSSRDRWQWLHAASSLDHGTTAPRGADRAAPAPGARCRSCSAQPIHLTMEAAPASMPSLQQIGLALRTARHLRPQQLAAQLAHRLRGPARTPRRTLADGISGLAPCASPWAPSPEGLPDADGAVALVGRPPHDPRTQGWEPGANALWSYTLHYHGWLSHPALEARGPGEALSIVESWIGEHREGVGWEPYPTSMRVLHWLGWLHHHGAGLQAHTRERVLGSLAAQLEHLAAHVETHLDGNHLWTNLVALTTAGVALRGPLPQRLLERFGPALVDTVRDQLAGDGVHGERTPTYHCVLAEQLAGLLSF